MSNDDEDSGGMWRNTPEYRAGDLPSWTQVPSDFNPHQQPIASQAEHTVGCPMCGGSHSASFCTSDRAKWNYWGSTPEEQK